MLSLSTVGVCERVSDPGFGAPAVGRGQGNGRNCISRGDVGFREQRPIAGLRIAATLSSDPAHEKGATTGRARRASSATHENTGSCILPRQGVIHPRFNQRDHTTVRMDIGPRHFAARTTPAAVNSGVRRNAETCTGKLWRPESRDDFLDYTASYVGQPAEAARVQVSET